MTGTAQWWPKGLCSAVQVEGLPQSALELAAQQAKDEGEAEATAEKGPWLFTLDFPSFFPVITHSKNRCVRLCATGCCWSCRHGDKQSDAIIWCQYRLCAASQHALKAVGDCSTSFPVSFAKCCLCLTTALQFMLLTWGKYWPTRVVGCIP